MSTPIVFNGVNYLVPAFGDVGYAQGPGNMSAYWIALAGGTVQNTGGLFPLTAQLNFGPNFGLTAVNFTSTTTNSATAGSIRLATADTIDWRNNANTLNLPLGINGLDQLTFAGVVLSTNSVLSVSGTANQIISTGGANPVLSLSSTLVLPGTLTAGGAIAMGTNKITGLGNGTAAQDAVAFNQLKVIQVVFTSVRDTATTTSSTFAVSGFAATITPTSASNKVLIIVSGQLTSATQTNEGQATILRGTSNLGSANGMVGVSTTTGGSLTGSGDMVFIDSPSTTSATTYNVSIRSPDNTSTVTYGNGRDVTIVLMEVVV